MKSLLNSTVATGNKGLNSLTLWLNFMRKVVELIAKFYGTYFIFYDFSRFLKNVGNRPNYSIYRALEGPFNTTLQVYHGYYTE